jgi:hypothetical protein
MNARSAFPPSSRSSYSRGTTHDTKKGFPSVFTTEEAKKDVGYTNFISQEWGFFFSKPGETGDIFPRGPASPSERIGSAPPWSSQLVFSHRTFNIQLEAVENNPSRQEIPLSFLFLQPLLDKS